MLKKNLLETIWLTGFISFEEEKNFNEVSQRIQTHIETYIHIQIQIHIYIYIYI